MRYPIQTLPPIALILALCSGSAQAQNLGVTFVTDSGTDSVFRMEDLNLDGDYNDAGEVVNYYDETLGNITLGNNVGIAVGGDGIVYVCDSSSDLVMALEDTDNNGTCNESTDHSVFFDGTVTGNAGGIEMASALNLILTPDGRMWVAVANNSTGVDQILRLEDLNNDGDANDAGEAFSFFEPATGGSIADSIVQDVVFAQDGNFYYLEMGSSGFYSKGVYKLVDGNNDGMIDPVTEVSTFFIPPTQINTPFYWGFTQGSDGAFYMADTSNELIWRFQDADANGTIDNTTEASIWWSSPSSSLIWQVVATSDGALYCAESQAPDRVLRMIDANHDGSIDPLTEVDELYDDTLSPIVISNPRGLTVVEGSELGTPFCFGDGSGVACPCGNNGTSEAGCLNSSNAGGLLEASGIATVSQDSLVLTASSCPPNRPGLFFQGTIEVNGGAGLAFGDGLRCAGGSIVRLEIVVTDETGSAASTQSIATASSISTGDLRTYQFWFRDPVMSPCGTEFNTTNGFSITWN